MENATGDFFDAHSHPQFAAYDADREDVLARARAARVKIIAVGTQFSASEAAVALAKKYPGEIWATAGFHPAHFSLNWYHDKNEQKKPEREKFEPDKLLALGKEKEVVAIGECGLDYFRDKSPEAKAGQKDGFLAQTEIARKLHKPLMVHCRSAFPDLVDILNSEFRVQNFPPGIIHFFTGTENDAKKLLNLGFYFTFGGVITFSRDYDDVIKMIPSDRILSETDAPYVAPAPYRGKRNEPAYVMEVVKKLAELKNISKGGMAERIDRNARRVFFSEFKNRAST